MSTHISSRIKGISPSATVAITARAQEMKEQGIAVISFAAGQPDFDTPEVAKEAAKNALDAGFTKYTDSAGILELKAAIAEKLRRENNISYDPDQIIVTNGAKQALFEIIMTLSESGDEVAYQVPFWVSYPEMIKASGATPVAVPSNDSFKITPEILKQSLTDKTRLFILNSPSNPTGIIYSKRELSDLADVLLSYDLTIISDECYDQFYYGDCVPASIASLTPELYTRTVTINSASKSYSMTGWRVGYAAGDRSIIKPASALHSNLTGNICSFAQKGAIAAYTHAQDFPQTMRDEFKVRRDCLVDGLNSISGIKAHRPDGAFYVFADISALSRDSVLFAKDLLEKVHVAVIPGKPFGMDGYVRFSFATSMDAITEGLSRIKTYVSSRTSYASV